MDTLLIHDFFKHHKIDYLSFKILNNDFILVEAENIKLKARVVMDEAVINDLIFYIKFQNKGGVKSIFVSSDLNDDLWDEFSGEDMYRHIRFLSRLLAPLFKESLSHMFMNNTNKNVNVIIEITPSLLGKYFIFELDTFQYENSHFPKRFSIIYNQNLAMITVNEEDPEPEINAYSMEMMRNCGFDFINIYFSRALDYNVSEIIDLSQATNFLEAYQMIEEIKPVVEMIKI